MASWSLRRSWPTASGCAALDVEQGLLELVQAEDVFDDDLLLQSEADVVAEQQATLDVDDVARDTVVLGTDALIADHDELLTTEDLLSAVVERGGDRSERAGVFFKPRTDDLVVSTLERFFRGSFGRFDRVGHDSVR